MTPTPVDGESGALHLFRNPQFSCLFSRSPRSISAGAGRTEAKPEQRDVGKSVEFVLRAFTAALILFSLSDRGLASVLADAPVVQTTSLSHMEIENMPTAIPAAERVLVYPSRLGRCPDVRSTLITHAPAGDAASCQPAQFPVLA